jgi:hypothetical protein
MLRSYSVLCLDDDEEDAMGAGARCGRGAVAAQKKWASHRCVSQGIGPVSLLGFWLVRRTSIREPLIGTAVGVHYS